MVSVASVELIDCTTEVRNDGRGAAALTVVPKDTFSLPL